MKRCQRHGGVAVGPWGTGCFFGGVVGEIHGRRARKIDFLKGRCAKIQIFRHQKTVGGRNVD